MHLLMSFIGCFVTLMAITGLEDKLKSAFEEFEKNMISKFFPVVVKELLRPYISDIHDKNGMDKVLDEISQESKTARL